MLFVCAGFYSCRNISAQDFGPDDIANILEVILKGDETDSPTEPPAEPEEITEPTEPTDGLEPNPETSSEPADAPGETTTDSLIEPTEPPEPTTDSQIQTEPPAPEPDENGENQPNQNDPEQSNFATIINIRSVFPDAPEKFHDIPFPEAVRMTDSLKRNIKNLADFTSKDFGGMNFYVATTDPKLFTPLYGGGMLSDARRYRTEIVDAECNTEIISLEKDGESLLQEIRISLQADEFVSDIICVPFSIQSELIRNGFLMNLKKIPFLNFSAEYYNSSATDAFTVNGNVFGLASDLTFDPSSVHAMFYNKSLVRDYNLTNPVQMHKDGKWDYDGLFAISRELTSAIADLNHDLRWSVGLDPENKDIIGGLFASSGGTYFTKRDYSYPVLNFNNQKAQRFIEAIANILRPASESGMENYLVAEAWNQNRAFINGNVLFSIAKLDLIPEITTSEFDWGLLPLPVINAENARYSFTDNSAMAVSVLRNTRNTEACGIVMSALSMASHRQLKDIYVLEQMTYHLRDVDSVNILSEIVGDIAFSQYNAYSTFSEVVNATSGLLTNAVNGRAVFADAYENQRLGVTDFFRNSSIFARS